jgi:DNA-binding response OmpR family regulator
VPRPPARAEQSLSPPRLLLVEDDLDLAAGLGDYLSANGVMVDFAHSAREAEHVLAGAAFDLLVLDVQLPGEDGVSLCRRLIREQGLRTPVLFLTARGGLDAKLAGFAAGALDYVVKPFEPAELLARVRAITQRSRDLQPVGLEVGDWRLDAAAHTLWRGATPLGLAESGVRLLQALMRAHPGWVRHEALHEALWQGDPPGSVPLRAHMHLLRRSLAAAFGHAPIATLRGVGYRFAADGGDGDGDGHD